MRNLIFLLALSCTAFAAEVKSTATLIPEVSTVAPGKPFTVALKLEHPEECIGKKGLALTTSKQSHH